MFLLLRFAHLMGLTLFMGSLIAYNVAYSIGAKITSQEFLHYSKFIDALSLNTTLFGLVLTIGSGAFLIGFGKYQFGKSRWLLLKILLSVYLVLSTMFMIMPNVNAALHYANSLPKGITQNILNKLAAAKDTVHLYATINVFVCILISYLGVAKGTSFSFFGLLKFNKKPKV